MKNISLIVADGTDAARRELCLRRGRGCRWNWSQPELLGTPGLNVLRQEAWCEVCGEERTTQLTMKVEPKDIV